MLSVPGKILGRIILQRLIVALSGILRDQQMGVRKNRSCNDNIATLIIIPEQSLAWNGTRHSVSRLGSSARSSTVSITMYSE